MMTVLGCSTSAEIYNIFEIIYHTFANYFWCRQFETASASASSSRSPMSFNCRMYSLQVWCQQLLQTLVP